MRKTFFTCCPCDMEVEEALEYSEIKSGAKQTPKVTLLVKYTTMENVERRMAGKSFDKIVIEDKSVLFKFLQAIDKDLQYRDMVYTMYDMMPPYRPPLKDIIQEYLDSSAGGGFERLHPLRLGFWVESEDDSREGTMVSVAEGDTTASRYHHATAGFIGVDILHEWTNAGTRHMYGKDKRKYPIMRFQKTYSPSVFLGHEGLEVDTMIEILSYRSKTYITSRILGCGDESIPNDIQPLDEVELVGWTHAIPADLLHGVLRRVERATRDAIEFLLVTLPQRPSTGVPVNISDVQSSRLENFHDRNTLERATFSDLYKWVQSGGPWSDDIQSHWDRHKRIMEAHNDYIQDYCFRYSYEQQK